MKKPSTPRSQVRSALRRLWLRSRERQAALKRDKYSCVECGVKQSRAKGKRVDVEVDHLDGIEWENILAYIYRHLLVPVDRLETVCKTHHAERTEQRKEPQLVCNMAPVPYEVYWELAKKKKARQDAF